MFRRFAAAICLFGLLGLPVQAQTMINGQDLSLIVDLAKGYGSAELSKQKNGNPLINGRVNGIKYGIYFYSCKENKDCTAMQFYAGWKVGDVTRSEKLAKINEWNRTKRFGRAYLDRVGDIAVEMDMNMAYGVTRANMDDNFDYWRLISKQAQDFFKF